MYKGVEKDIEAEKENDYENTDQVCNTLGVYPDSITNEIYESVDNLGKYPDHGMFKGSDNDSI